MLICHCARIFKKTVFPTFAECSRKFHRHCRHVTRVTPLLSSSFESIQSSDKRSYGNVAAVTCQKLDHRSLVQVSGADILGFLQGLVTNDVRLLESDDSTMYAMMLNVQGRVLYDLFLYRLKAEKPTVIIECHRDVSSELVGNLLRYKLRKKVEITDVASEFSVWSVFSELGGPADSISVTNKDVILCVKDPRHEGFGHRLIQPANNRPLVDGASVTTTGYETWRCRAGVGEGTVDFPPGQCFPLEANLDFMNGVSFSKGCYIGQELTARTNYTGVIRKRIMPLSFSSITQDVKPGAVVVNCAGKECGKVRSVFGSHGLGLLRIADVTGRGTLDVKDEDAKVAEAETWVPTWWPSTSDAVVQQAVTRTEKAAADD